MFLRLRDGAGVAILGGMEFNPHLPMQIASGILLAFCISWWARSAAKAYHAKGGYFRLLWAAMGCAIFFMVTVSGLYWPK